jgi:hypothetical protein
MRNENWQCWPIQIPIRQCAAPHREVKGKNEEESEYSESGEPYTQGNVGYNPLLSDQEPIQKVDLRKETTDKHFGTQM